MIKISEKDLLVLGSDGVFHLETSHLETCQMPGLIPVASCPSIAGKC